MRVALELDGVEVGGVLGEEDLALAGAAHQLHLLAGGVADDPAAEAGALVAEVDLALVEHHAALAGEHRLAVDAEVDADQLAVLRGPALAGGRLPVLVQCGAEAGAAALGHGRCLAARVRGTPGAAPAVRTGWAGPAGRRSRRAAGRAGRRAVPAGPAGRGTAGRGCGCPSGSVPGAGWPWGPAAAGRAVRARRAGPSARRWWARCAPAGRWAAVRGPAAGGRGRLGRALRRAEVGRGLRRYGRGGGRPEGRDRGRCPGRRREAGRALCCRGLLRRRLGLLGDLAAEVLQQRVESAVEALADRGEPPDVLEVEVAEHHGALGAELAAREGVPGDLLAAGDDPEVAGADLGHLARAVERGGEGELLDVRRDLVEGDPERLACRRPARRAAGSTPRATSAG